jgi:hypothetical protein
MRIAIFTLLLFCFHSVFAQTKSYFYQIPAAPNSYSATSVAARLIDGLGFRYYWATEGLTDKDLQYSPSSGARTSLETIDHIYGLSVLIVNAVSKKPSVFGDSAPEKLSFTQLREKTLGNLQTVSELLRKTDAQLEDFDLIIQRGDKKQEYPFWNLINGPIADALWHVGQVVSFRRASGNPFPKGVSVLSGTKLE